jgi:hypothetical protein
MTPLDDFLCEAQSEEVIQEEATVTSEQDENFIPF